jgi:beta-aspartyl-dipeptidase (metallo-type)
MLTMLKNGEVYAPEYIGIKDILIGNSFILAIGDDLRPDGGLQAEVIDCSGLRILPGLIDPHVHIAGAGGEGGPGTRTPELQVGLMTEAGVTTVIGCLGTDGFTRSVDSVLMKVKSLRAKGLSAWMYTGAYQFPVPSITGDFARDIALFEEVIGVGEIAISDHRSSNPSVAELSRVAAHARVAGMIGGKAGIVNVHMGDAQDPFRPIHQVVESSMLGYKQFMPTHCNRNPYIFKDSLEYGKKGWIDLTTSSYPYFPDEEIKPSRALKQLLEAGVPLAHITFSSDACGSLPAFDPVTGELVRLEIGKPDANLRELKDCVVQEGIPLEKALQVLTSNPAIILKLPRKGQLKPGYDADILVLDPYWNISHLFALGQKMEN